MRLAALYETGLSLHDISKRTGIPYGTVRHRLVRVGVRFDGPARISAKMKGQPGHRKGKVHTKEARLKMSQSRAGVPKLWQRGRKHSDATKEKIKLAWTARRIKYPESFLTKAEAVARDKVRNAAKRFIYRLIRMSAARKSAPTELLLGYTRAELRSHIEKQFRPGMSWENRGSFHIDHKTPVAVFLRQGITDFAIINALSNLQVLTPAENRKKSDKVMAGEA